MTKLIKLIKDNIIFIISLIVILIIANIKLPYYIETTGGLINLKDRFMIENSYSSSGSLNMTYVKEYDVNPFLYIVAKINKDMDLVKKEEINYPNETVEETNYRGIISLKEANDNAIIVAYKYANKDIEISSDKLFVTYIDIDAKTDLKIKDQIIKVNNIEVNDIIDIHNIIKENINDKISITVKRDEKEIERYAYLNKGVIGILLAHDRVIKTNPDIKINYQNGEYGPSGGLMATLAIYNGLVKEDITQNLKIAGTGTIDYLGNVGSIDGVKYKLKGAVKKKADIFLVPAGENYKEAIALKKKHNYKIKIIEVSNFTEALEKIKKL